MHHLGLRAIAEGVEDLALMPELRDLGCDAVQGYGISKPLPADNATVWLRERSRLTQADEQLRSAA